MINQKLLAELQMLMKEEYNLDLNSREVFEIGETLLNYFSTLNEIHDGK